MTSRTRDSELWFANNQPVEDFTLALLAKLKDRHRFNLYAFCLEGSHTHMDAIFPLSNRSDFARDFNSGIAKAVARLTPNYPGGRLFERRYSNEHLPDPEDIERQFFYIVLQPVKDNLVDKISEYPFYNCFHDAVCGIKRKLKVINWVKYHEIKRYNSKVKPQDFIEVYYLSYERLPGYEHLSQHEYRVLMEKKLEEHRQRILEQRRQSGRTKSLGADALLQTIPGTPAKNPKRSTRRSHRPRVLTGSRERRKALWHGISRSTTNSKKPPAASEPENWKLSSPLAPTDRPRGR